MRLRNRGQEPNARTVEAAGSFDGARWTDRAPTIAEMEQQGEPDPDCALLGQCATAAEAEARLLGTVPEQWPTWEPVGICEESGDRAAVVTVLDRFVRAWGEQPVPSTVVQSQIKMRITGGRERTGGPLSESRGRNTTYPRWRALTGAELVALASSENTPANELTWILNIQHKEIQQAVATRDAHTPAASRSRGRRRVANGTRCGRKVDRHRFVPAPDPRDRPRAAPNAGRLPPSLGAFVAGSLTMGRTITKSLLEVNARSVTPPSYTPRPGSSSARCGASRGGLGVP